MLCNIKLCYFVAVAMDRLRPPATSTSSEHYGTRVQSFNKMWNVESLKLSLKWLEMWLGAKTLRILFQRSPNDSQFCCIHMEQFLYSRNMLHRI